MVQFNVVEADNGIKSQIWRNLIRSNMYAKVMESTYLSVSYLRRVTGAQRCLDKRCLSIETDGTPGSQRPKFDASLSYMTRLCLEKPRTI